MTGFHLHGDDFGKEQISQWFEEESEYHNAFENGRWSESYPFVYHYYNSIFGIGDLLKPGIKVLDFGCAEGLTLSWCKTPVDYHGVDASETFLEIAKKNNPKGTFKLIRNDQLVPYRDGTFDMILCFGVLHHIPNVSFVLKEFARVLKIGGKVFIREPITDMRKMDGSRVGLSPNERGIHPLYFYRSINSSGLRLEKVDLCFWGPLNYLREYCKNYPTLVRPIIWADRAISRLYRPEEVAYARRSVVQKLAPNTAYFLLTKAVEK